MIFWKFTARIHFRPVDKWLLQVGVSCHTNSVDSEDLPDMPIGHQIRYAAGANLTGYRPVRSLFRPTTVLPKWTRHRVFGV